MSGRKEYIIQFAGLSIGAHDYEYTVTDRFFKDLEYSEVHEANVLVNVKLLKQSGMLVLEFALKGTVKTECDRCTEEFDMPIEGNYRLIVKIGGSETGDENDDIITIAANDHELDIAQYIYEYIILSLPIKRVHPDDAKGKPTCNKEMLKNLNNFLIEEEKQDDNPVDPRWDGLKNITLN